MNRRIFIRDLGLLAAAPLSATAQPARKAYRIGFLRRTSPEPAAVEAFRQGLRDFGYNENQNVVIEERYAHGLGERLPALAADLVRSNMDVIVVDGTPTAVVVKTATASIPVVFVLGIDPVSYGLVASLARPGGNFTGLTLAVGYELAGKRLELLKAAVPNVSRLAILANPTLSITAPFMRDAERAARALGLDFQTFEAASPGDLTGAFSAMAQWRADGLNTLNDAMFFSQRQRIVELATKNRLPAMHPEAEFVQTGGLMSYGPDFDYLFRRAAFYVDKILKGARPADLPVEQPTKFQFVINVKTATALGLMIAPSVLLRADHVIR
jgi:putative tryptophan/tyrosine transport system substrate-binding protein